MLRNMYIFEPWGLSYKRGGDAHRKFGIKPLKETNLGVGRPFLTPERDQLQCSLVVEVIENFDYMN